MNIKQNFCIVLETYSLPTREKRPLFEQGGLGTPFDLPLHTHSGRMARYLQHTSHMQWELQASLSGQGWEVGGGDTFQGEHTHTGTAEEGAGEVWI